MASLSSPSQCPQIELVTKLILCPSCGPDQPFLTLDKCAQIFSFLDIFSLENLLSFQCKYYIQYNKHKHSQPHFSVF